jgi:isoamylase
MPFTTRPYPLGATVNPDGVNFALYSETAARVELVLFDDPAGPPARVVPLDNCTKHVFHTLVSGVAAGQLYGYRVSGPFDPGQGLRFNEHKLLIDPYAKAITGKVANVDNLLLGYNPASPARDLSRDTRDNVAIVPKSIVIDDRFDWQDDRPPDHAFHRSVIYEVHLKGFTAHPSSRVTHPGTYLGFVQKIPYLQDLGITAVELLPLHEFYVDDFLRERGLTNYWGYNTIGFFAPESSYAAGAAPGAQVTEFKTLVRELHKADIEVILDVVYNHSGEGNELGPTISFRGVDNRTYYSLTGPPDEPLRFYRNDTGCGNTLNLAHTHVIRLVMDSLRYWVEVMHVDGFRFDLAAVLGRDAVGFEKSASFFDAIAQDPVLQRVKLIAEPWDLATYQVGNFPVDWSEWNGRFRDTVRRFGKGDGGQLGDLGRRLTGSADLYGDDGRSPYNSVNFVTCHDGFTLHDLVSYDAKHNEANGEGNRDGTDSNDSWNCGAEGETANAGILALRRQQIKNYACLLLFSAGTPMMLGGDEFGRTQRGNNNAYCQDTDLSWFDWDRAAPDGELTTFFRKAIALTARYSILERRKFFSEASADGRAGDIAWFGTDLGPPRWDDPEARTVAFLLNGTAASPPGAGYLLFTIANGDFRLHRVALPAPLPGTKWFRVIDTSLEAGEDFLDAGAERLIDPADAYLVNPRSWVVLVTR